MKMNLSLIPLTGNEQVDALREYESMHAQYMNTSVFTEEGRRIKSRLSELRERYIAAVKAANPTWLVM